MIIASTVENAFLSNNTGYILGACVIVLGSVVFFLYRELKDRQKRIDDIQEQRLAEARETQAKLIEPMQRVITLSETIKDAVLSGKRGI